MQTEQTNVWAQEDAQMETTTAEPEFQAAKTGKSRRKQYHLKKSISKPYNDTKMNESSSEQQDNTEEPSTSTTIKSIKRNKTIPQNSNYVSVRIAANRFTALKTEWESIYTPIVEKLHLQVRVNTKQQKVEIRIPNNTKKQEDEEESEDNEMLKNLTKARDFVQAFMLGFSVEDSLALLRLDDIYIESFDVKDVKRSLQGDHLSRAIARIAGKGGAVKFTIENATKTRIVVADARIHVMGSFANIQLARSAIVDLILGSPPGVVYNKLRTVSQRLKEQF
ncbi:predicted protein [Naegleria gruberi]|uniref:Predicted protein n=1 Tax=Naegleria gruberi TaxID=5762 RepID=D2VHL0_NAEGR|nr:uncharacterized protein NAEGRDRAFT_79995 [Naegleria gruberi]EFC43607.1 predicted protein [Naegleria gruberi]|eukprot:XP_002676351.1 predicted protein [Naegleria gruberi strain NEG-M]